MLALLRLSVLLLAFLAFAPAAHAQAHDTGPNSYCRFGPPWHIRPESVHNCAACLADIANEAKARREEQDRRGKAANARALAEKTALEVASAKKRQQDVARQRSAEVLINGGKPFDQLFSPESIKAAQEAAKYKVVNAPNPGNDRQAHANKVLYNGKLAFSTSRFVYIDQVVRRAYFMGILPLPNRGCDGDYQNYRVLLDKTGKEVKLGNIDRFGFISLTDLESPDHFEVVVYDNTCSNINDNRDYKARWHTIRHLYRFSTLQEVGSEESAQLDTCDCSGQ